MTNTQLTVRSMLGVAFGAVLIGVIPCEAQVTAAAGYTPPDDTPAIRLGATIFADYTVQQQPRVEAPPISEVPAAARQNIRQQQ